MFTFTQYVSCVLTRVFLFCWYGCEVNEKVNIKSKTYCRKNIIEENIFKNILKLMQSKYFSTEIYNSEWLALGCTDRRKLLLSLMVAEQGSSISFHGLCFLNLQTFGWVSTFVIKLKFH